MENLRNFYEKYRVYLTRPRLELLAVVAIVFCAVLVFFLNIPGKGVLKLDNGTIVLDVDGVYLTFELAAIKTVLPLKETASLEGAIEK